MRLVLITMFLLSIGRVSSCQEAYTVIESGTLPLRHYVGDQVTLRVGPRADGGERIKTVRGVGYLYVKSSTASP